MFSFHSPTGYMEPESESVPLTLWCGLGLCQLLLQLQGAGHHRLDVGLSLLVVRQPLLVLLQSLGGGTDRHEAPGSAV